MNYSCITMEAARMMKMASPMIPPSGRAPEKGSRCDRFGTEACDGGVKVLGYFPRVSKYIGFFSVGITQNGPTRGPQACMARP